MNPKLSIITINLNNVIGLQKTIESVINQSFTDYEYIIIDGGSTDGSVDIIKQYADKITYWISEPDKGIYNAMNKGILQATGDYCQFLNSGDLLASEVTLANIFAHNPSSNIIYGNMIKQKDGVEENCDVSFSGRFISLYDMYIGTLNHPSSFIKRDLFSKYGFYDDNLRIVSDWKFFFETIGLNGVETEYINEAVTIFDLNGISSSNFTLRYRERDLVITRLLPESIHTDYRKMKIMLSKYELVERINSHPIARWLFKLICKVFI